MKCEPITELGLAIAATRAGLRARMIFFAFTARRTRAIPLFAAFARAVVRAGFARRTVLRTGRLPCIAIRVRAVLRFAAVVRFAVVVRFAATVLRAGLARRTVFRAVVFPTARRARDGLFFAVRFRDVLDLVNITTYPPQLKVSRPSLLWVNTM